MGISIWQLLIVLLIVLVLFGTRRLRNLGSDLGGAIRGFKEAMGSGSDGEEREGQPPPCGHIKEEEPAEPTPETGVKKGKGGNPERKVL